MTTIEIQTQGAIRTVTLNRPDKHNAIDPEMMTVLTEAFAVEPPDTERVTVLRGNGRSFCSGLQLATTGVDHAEAVRIETLFDTVQRYPLPVVAIVQGKAIAGGCELALHCDFIVAQRNAQLIMPLAQIGVSTTWFLTKKIMEAVGPALGREFLLLGEPLGAERLHALGLVARIADADDVDREAQFMIDRLAANAPLSMRTMKRMLIELNDHYFARDYAAHDERAAKSTPAPMPSKASQPACRSARPYSGANDQQPTPQRTIAEQAPARAIIPITHL